jgi:HAD superfamily hydrolase (TIGR01509 family)
MTLLFDLDGTLVDCKELHFEALNRALVENGYEEISLYDHVTFYEGLPTVEKLKALKIPNPDKVNADKQAITYNLIPYYVEFDSKVWQALKVLKREYKMFCVSNSKKESMERILEEAGLIDLFDELISCEDVQNPKPAPDIYLYAKKLANDECFAFEDNENGVNSAKSAGIPVFKVDSSEDIRYNKIKEALC